jgi:putative selenate reductase
MSCNQCIPVCPNDANFTLPVRKGAFALERLVPDGGRWKLERAGELTIRKAWQIGVFADACNECGNCDVFCPEDGAPYRSKPLFFGSVAAWAQTPERDGFAFETLAHGLRMHGRLDGRAVSVETKGGKVRYRGDGFDLRLDPADPGAGAAGSAAGPVDLAPLRIMELLRSALADANTINFVTAGLKWPT